MSKTIIPFNSSSVIPNNTTTTTIEAAVLSTAEMIEMLKNLAAVNEKLHKWEQSMKKLQNFPDNDSNKMVMKDIIDFIDHDKSSTQDKAIYLYGQLGHKCHEQKNFMGAAKAYERAATLRFDSPNVLNDKSSNETKMTIQYLESAIVNYDAIHKYKHAGTLHYRCSRILRLMNASPEEVAKHYGQALEYFTMRNHEVKHRKRIDGLKISCYSSSNSWGKRKLDCNQRCCRDVDYFVTHAPKYSRYSDDCESNHSTNQEEYYISVPSCSKNQDIYPMETDLLKTGLQPLRKDMLLQQQQQQQQQQHQTLKQNRCLEDRIESAKKLVKKLHKFCPYYEVTTNGDDAGRVYCKICERHLGAVSSTLKNHVNTQEHKQALEDSISGNSNENNNKIPYKIPASKLNNNSNNNQITPQNGSQMQSTNTGNNSSLDFEGFDIAWVPGFQSPTSVDYAIGICDNNNHSDNCNHPIIPTKAITAL